MNLFLRFLYVKLARPAALWVLGVLTVTIYLLMIASLPIKVSGSILNLQLAFTQQTAMKIMASWGSEGIATFLRFFWLDYIFPLGYGGFLAGAFSHLARSKTPDPTSKQLGLFSLPLLAAGFDLLENIFLFFVLTSGWIPSPVLVFVASLAAAIKYLFLAMTLGAIAWYVYTLNKQRA